MNCSPGGLFYRRYHHAPVRSGQTTCSLQSRHDSTSQNNVSGKSHGSPPQECCLRRIGGGIHNTRARQCPGDDRVCSSVRLVLPLGGVRLRVPQRRLVTLQLADSGDNVRCMSPDDQNGKSLSSTPKRCVPLRGGGTLSTARESVARQFCIITLTDNSGSPE